MHKISLHTISTLKCKRPRVWSVLPIGAKICRGRSLLKGGRLRPSRQQCRVVKGVGGVVQDLWWRVECVGTESGPGEEAQACPFGELGEQVAGLDLEVPGEFAAAPVPAWAGVHDRHDALPAGGRLGSPGGAGRIAGLAGG